jgi:mono/diheme cytochrome c family protein
MKRFAVVIALGAAASLTLGARGAAAQTSDGATVYRQHCRTCHGATGTPTARMLGLYPKLKTLSDSTLMASLTVDSIVNLVKAGRGDMKPFAEKLSAAEIRAVAEYVRTLPSAHKP